MAVDAQGNEIGKLFVGGLDQTTTQDSLKTYFSRYGEVEESLVMMDTRTNRSRGFGYIKFKDPESVEAVLSEKNHVVDRKEVDPKKCNVKMRGKNQRRLKVFVGGIAIDHDENVIRNFFSQFGKVTDVNLLSYPNRQRHRGFAFVGFEDEDVTKRLINMHYLNLNGKQVEVKAMEPQYVTRNNQMMSMNSFPPGIINRFGAGARSFRGTKPAYGDLYPWNHWPSGGASEAAHHSMPPWNHHSSAAHLSSRNSTAAAAAWNQQQQQHHHPQAHMWECSMGPPNSQSSAHDHHQLAQHHQEHGWLEAAPGNSSNGWPNTAGHHWSVSQTTASSNRNGAGPLDNWSAMCQAAAAIGGHSNVSSGATGQQVAGPQQHQALGWAAHQGSNWSASTEPSTGSVSGSSNGTSSHPLAAYAALAMASSNQSWSGGQPTNAPVNSTHPTGGLRDG